MIKEEELFGVDKDGECVPVVLLLLLFPDSPGGAPDMLEAERCDIAPCRRVPPPAVVALDDPSPPAVPSLLLLPPRPGGIPPLISRRVW